MKVQVKELLSQKGYSPIYRSIDSSIRDLKRHNYTRSEIIETLDDMFGDDGIITRYIHKNVDLVR